MPVASTTALAIGLGGGLLYNTLKQKAPKMPALPVMPEAPKPEPLDAVTRAKKRQRTRATGASGRASTLLTGPQGITTPASVAPKTLLGQ